MCKRMHKESKDIHFYDHHTSTKKCVCVCVVWGGGGVQAIANNRQLEILQASHSVK